MTSDRTRDLLLPLAVLVSVAAGAALGSLFTRGNVNPAAQVTASVGDTKDLVDALQALRTELAHARDLHEPLNGRTQGADRVDASEPSAPSSANLVKELRTAIAEFTISVDALRGAVNRLGGDSAPLIPPLIPPDPKLLDDVGARTPEENVPAYMLWTYQQVLDRFGMPRDISRSEVGPSWYYVSSSGWQISFHFTDGRVISVSTNR